MSRKKRTSKNGHRKVRRNRYVLINRARGALRRLTRNVAFGGIDVMEKIVFPALGATGGAILAQWLGSKVGPSLLPGQDPRLIALGAAAASAFGAYKLGDSLGISPETQQAVAAGAGITAILPWVPAGVLPMASFAPPPANAVSGYYHRGTLNGLMVDVSHAGAPYKGMLGLGSDPSDQNAVDDVLSAVEAISTVEPMDMALPAVPKKAFRRVRETMGTPGDRGWAGGVYARNIFSGMAS